MTLGALQLAAAIGLEILATSFIKTTDGFTIPLPTALVASTYLLSYLLLARAVRTIDLSVAYAVWSGVGTAAITIVAIVVLGERASVERIVGVGLIVGGVLLLDLSETA